MNWFFTTVFKLFIGTVTCQATVFGGLDDQLRGGEAVCLHREIGPDDVGIAHRLFPCGTRVILENPRNGCSIVARVIDHGPYGALWHGRWKVKRTVFERGEWRGCVDLTEKAARLLGHNGLEPVTVRLPDAPVVKREDTILTRWRRWFDSTRGH